MTWYIGALKLSGLGFLTYQFYQNLSFYYLYRNNKTKVIDILYDYEDIMPKMYPMNRISKDEWNYFQQNFKNGSGISDFYDEKLKKHIRDIIIYRRKIHMYLEKIDYEDPKGLMIIEEDILKRIYDLILHINIFYWDRHFQKDSDPIEKKEVKEHLRILDKGYRQMEKYISHYFQDKPILFFDLFGIYNSMIYLPPIVYFTHKWFF
jgi:hypothetical protein